MHIVALLCIFFFFNDTATTEIYTLSLHDALPISYGSCSPTSATCATCGGTSPSTTSIRARSSLPRRRRRRPRRRSEEHTSELQSQSNLVCRLLLAKKN